jgi:two-component system chemotaxis response regulator CheY
MPHSRSLLQSVGKRGFDRDSIRILVADTDGDTRSEYRESLTLAGCDVVDAEDGRDALVSALMQRPTLVITETRLPMLDGYALCEILRSDSMTRTVPILVVTGEISAAELNRARAAGADAVLLKPVAPDALLKEIQRLLNGSFVPPQSCVSAETSPMSRESVNGQRRKPQARAYARVETASPPIRPPSILCPACDRELAYERSYLGGVSGKHPEQWDDYKCPGSCGTFEYRQRTRKLRRVA